MEEEMMNNEMTPAESNTPTPERQGVMGANIADTEGTTMIEEGIKKVKQNFENLSQEEKNLATQLNVPQFRNFMSKLLLPEIGPIMEGALPSPTGNQQVSQPSESPAPTQGQGMMTQPPSA
tara:strand:- start:51 stop:413 length:363 start_codon:yes stop_codon:yes gene_type:complete